MGNLPVKEEINNFNSINTVKNINNINILCKSKMSSVKAKRDVNRETNENLC